MKRFCFLFVLTLLVGLSACNKVDYPATLDLVEVIDKSEIVVHTDGGEISSEGLSIVNDSLFIADYEEDAITKIVFEDDENATITQWNASTSVTYTKEDNAFIFTVPIDGMSFSMTGTGDEEAMTLNGIAYIQKGDFSEISSINPFQTVDNLLEEFPAGDTLAVQTFKYDYIK